MSVLLSIHNLPLPGNEYENCAIGLSFDNDRRAGNTVGTPTPARPPAPSTNPSTKRQQQQRRRLRSKAAGQQVHIGHRRQQNQPRTRAYALQDHLCLREQPARAKLPRGKVDTFGARQLRPLQSEHLQ